MFTVRGTVKGVSPNGILLSDGSFEYFIRSSEVKMIKRLKDSVGDRGNG